MSDERMVVALPVKDEAERLSASLHALTNQDGMAAASVLVLVNNSTDDSAAIARRFAATAKIPVLVEDVVLREPDASAGGARRLAMHMAAELAGDDGVILTTDADGRVAPGWLRANLRALRAGADAVAGRALIDPADMIEADARECHYAGLLDEISAALDPDPADPWPRHDQHSGASIAVTVDAFHRAGGIPAVEMGEDRAFFRNLRRIDARIRHDPDVQVVVSGRTEGRAKGGMADTLRRRLACADMFLDDRLEGAQVAALRARLRRKTRLLWADGAADHWAVLALARDLGLPSMFVREQLACRRFGTSWDELETASSVLRRHPVPVAAVGSEIALACSILSERRMPEMPLVQAVGISA